MSCGGGPPALAAAVLQRAIDDLDLNGSPGTCRCTEDGWPAGACPRCKLRWSAARFLHNPSASAAWVELAGMDHEAVVSVLVARGVLPSLQETIDMTATTTVQG